MTRPQIRTRAAEAIAKLDKCLDHYVDRAWSDKFKAWLVPQLQELVSRHQLAIGHVKTGGEGVSTASSTGNPNQSPPVPEIPQCPVTGTATLPCSLPSIPESAPVPAQFPLQPRTGSILRSVTDAESAPAPDYATAPVPDYPVAIPDKPQIRIWPAETELTIAGYCLNPRLLAAWLPAAPGEETRVKVSLYRTGRNFRSGDRVMARLSQGGGNPIYSVV